LGISFHELIVLLMIPTFILWIVAFISVLRNEFTGINKVVWLLAVILVPLVGSLAYFVMGKKQRIQ
jgi:hypothetical protein